MVGVSGLACSVTCGFGDRHWNGSWLDRRRLMLHCITGAYHHGEERVECLVIPRGRGPRCRVAGCAAIAQVPATVWVQLLEDGFGVIEAI